MKEGIVPEYILNSVMQLGCMFLMIIIPVLLIILLITLYKDSLN